MALSEISKQPALVGIVPRKNLWDLIQNEKWYHIPVESAPNNAELAEYLGFYFPAVFGKEMRYKVNYYSKVNKIEIVKRLELFPEETKHKRVDSNYFKFYLGDIKELKRPIPSTKWRRITHIPTSFEKLMNAEEINDLYDASPLEDKMYLEMKKRKIATERQFYVKVAKQFYCLDFGIFCSKGKIDLECDGEEYHSSPIALANDRERNNELTSHGWQVIRFSGKEINRTMDNCFVKVERTISNLGGISKLAIPEGAY